MEVGLAGKQILITGGTGALGRAFVRRACEEKAAVFFTYHRNQKTAAELERLGARGFQLDLANRRDIDELKNKIKAVTSALDAIVHNAALVRDHTIQNLTEAEWNEVLSVDLDAVYYLTKKFLSFLFKKPGAKIIHVVSRSGAHGGFGQANYAAAKGGLIALTKTLAKELGKKEILVNAFNPGFMRSDMTEGLPPEVLERNVKESTLGRISNPEEASNFLIYLLSDRFRGVSGQVFHFDSRPTS